MHRCGRFLAVIALAACCLAGCATKPQTAGPAEADALVVVENHTDFEWRVSLEPAASAKTPAWQNVPPRGIVKLALLPGVYRARREIVNVGLAGASVSAGDAIDLSLAGGRTYTWPLATLLSNDGVGR